MALAFSANTVGNRARMAGPRKALAGAWEHQCARRQLDEGQIDVDALRHARDHPQVAVTFGKQERNQVVIDCYCPLPALGLGPLNS